MIEATKTQIIDRYKSLIIYAILIIATGVVLTTLAYYPSRTIQYVVAVGMILSSVFAFLTAYECKSYQVPLKYHALHAGGFIVYGFVILFMATDLSKFFNITTFFLLYYGFTEIIFCMELLMMRRQNLKFRNIFFRLMVGLLITAGAAVILSTSYIDQHMAIIGAGIVFIISGINLILFRAVLKRLIDAF